jgi:hypothetical protein
MGNPINSILQQLDQQNTPTAPPTPAALPVSAPAVAGAPAAGGSNPIHDLLTKFDSGTSPETSALPPVPSVLPPVPSVASQLPDQKPLNPVSDILKSFDVRSSSSLSPEELKQSTRPDPENQIDEPWYSKTWDWLNKPLYDAHKWGHRTGAGTIERGIESGVEDLISAQSSPLSLALIIATFGGAAVRSVRGLLAADKKADKEGAASVPNSSSQK